jgi:antitoxin YobK
MRTEILVKNFLLQFLKFKGNYSHFKQGHPILGNSMEEIKAIVAANLDKFEYFGNIDSKVVHAAEEYLNVKFPDSYKQYLQEWGVLEIDSSEFYGLIGSDFDNSSVPDVAWFNRTIREIKAIPRHLVIFRNIEGVRYYCLDTTRLDSRNECPVVIWNPVTNSMEESLNMNFAQFLKECIEIVLVED